tara:strand:+ start:133102 stop:134385 length:1284 start_codon:yes stop_codon:yes gene_type:complete
MKRIIILVLSLSSFIVSAQNERLSIVQYNLMWYRTSAPCTHNQSNTARDSELETIFNFANPDIFVVNEMGANPQNASFMNSSIFNKNSNRYHYASFTSNGSSLSNMLFYDSSKVVLFGQDFIDKDLSNNSLVRGIDVYKMYYKDAKFSQGADTVFFAIITAHLKAGSTNTDALQRLDATEALMDYLDNHLSIENVIFCGDFNVKTNSEPSFQKLINYSSAPSENFFDPVNQLGAWGSNANFASYHTQSTRSASSGCHSGGGLDDRFDFILISEEIKLGTEEIQYVPNSYSTIGQDGNHYNQSVNSGANGNVPSNIADALYNFSDHLPVRLQIDIKKSDIGIPEKNLEGRIEFNNPIQDLLKLKFDKELSENVELKIMNLTGRVVFQGILEAGTMEQSYNTENLSKGIYLMSFRSKSGEQISKKIVKR